ncbi:hypothetical protein COT75_05520 [Candidatus Beckwithbacteria bacterium CG10_big_fil_rev_8_21_14_0_10_34_10]|uniref:Carbohydrate-binding module family 96 domain-containing protein n=1 Tax=Candidatus Beckwithbacteria bacterium CG10_big_fil_rev_8_21_14_0_10_34_10 TaxID=1974495 RepID=A0A2H0W7S9_9BACT|nr:MAG: hypothetical protein COT75_05520 [Candidatus Beckwithbacteria bacterium CG10_big_fil_rev_8_21_14_0_10_34_10]
MNKVFFYLISSFLLLSLIYSPYVLAEDKKAPVIKPVLKKEPEVPQIKLDKDTYVDSLYPDLNFGTDPSLSAGYTSSTKIMFLQFNPSDLTLKNEEKVFLVLELDKSYGQMETIESEILLPSQSWEEEGLTWNNKPSLYDSELNIGLEATPGAQKIDLTPLVLKWQAGELENYGLAIYHSLQSFERNYFSRENEKKFPYLVVENQTPTDEKEKITASNEENNDANPLILSQEIDREILPFPEKMLKNKSLNNKNSSFELNNIFKQDNLLPVLGLWTTSVMAFLFKAFKEFA